VLHVASGGAAAGTRGVRIESPHPSRARARSPRGNALGPRLALSPDEAAALLGVSRDYLDERVIGELRIVRRGQCILIALAELQRWLGQSAARGSIARGA
jgi:excisionase family DNA binding protein